MGKKVLEVEAIQILWEKDRKISVLWNNEGDEYFQVMIINRMNRLSKKLVT